VTEPGLTMRRPVIEELVRLAAVEVPGVHRVGRAGPLWRRWIAGPPVRVTIRDGSVSVALVIVARPSLPLPSLTRAVRSAVAGALERLPTVELTSLTVVVDGVGT
jgi:uncharacterized alkaline shock family protein YloU